jgi:hypothetical protein
MGEVIMRPLMLVIGFVCALTAAAAGQRAGQGTRAVWGVSFEHDFSWIYTPPPQNAHAVFFMGEPIRFRVVVINDMPAVLSFSRREQAPGRLVVAGAPSTVARAGLGLERPLAAVLRRPGTEFASNWKDVIALEPGDKLEWSLGLSRAGGTMAPGRYEVNIVPDLPQAEMQRFAVGVAPVIFEVREPRGFGATIEMLRRQAMRQYVNDEYSQADETFDMLLRRYPQSHIAHVMKGNIALRLGQRERAVVSYNAALALLESGADQLFLTEGRPPAHALDEQRANLRGMIRTTQAAVR